MTLVRQAAASEIAVPSGAEREDVDPWIESRLLDSSWVDNRGSRDLLHSYGSGIDVAETEEESVRRWTVERKLWRKADALKDIPTNIVITKHGQGRAWKKRLPMPLEITRSPISELAFSLRPKRRFRKARLEAAHWNMRTSFEPRKCFNEFQYCRRQLGRT